jgi:hypothetical protein
MPQAAIVELANCGNLRTVRSALSQLLEEGSVVRSGPHHTPVYQLAAVEMAA